jgi:8-oxo-dGTP pyrophosphatase MutT (NUDIX family)
LKGYIEELRKLIGHYPVIMVGAAVLILDDQDRLLLLHRTDNDFWGIPGGSMEPGESLVDTVKRETREETGLEIEDLTFFEIFSGSDQHYVYPNGDEVYNVFAVYRSRHISGSLKLDPTEHTEANYFDLQSLPPKISPPIIPVIQKIIQNGSI